MDDQRFDHIIKEKIGEYEEPGFDPTALSALHHQMAMVSPWPWYSRYRTELVTASGMILCTLIIVWSQWYFGRRGDNLMKENTAEINAEQAQIESLLNEITVLKNLPPDTVQFIEGPTSAVYSGVLTQRIAKLEDVLMKLQNDLKAYQSGSQEALSDSENLFDSSEGWENRSLSFRSNRIQPKQKEQESSYAYNRTLIKPSRRMQPTLSAETMRDLEKHYRKGIGIRLGPTVEISRGLYDAGTSKIDFAGGVLGDFIFSPSISIETGVKFSHRFYEVAEADLTGRPLPNVDGTLGPLAYADVDSWIVEVPLNLKYRYPINMKTNWIAALGYSSLIYTRQVFEYDYTIDGNPNAHLNTSVNINKTKMYPGTLNISLGLGHQLKNNKILETALFYQHGLGEAGVEKMKANFFGIRGSYWFTIR